MSIVKTKVQLMRGLLAVAMLILPTVVLGAVVVVDTFTTAPINSNNINTPTYTSNQTGLDPTFVLGGARYISATRLSGSRYSVNLSDGFLDLGETTAIAMNWVLEYGHSADLNTDLSQGYLADFSARGLVLVFDQVDQPGASLTISMYTTGGGVSTVTRALQQTAPGGSLYEFYDFDNDFTGGADLTNIDRIRFAFSTTVSGTDISLKVLQVGSVPEPHTAVMLMLACGIVRAARRKRRFSALELGR